MCGPVSWPGTTDEERPPDGRFRWADSVRTITALRTKIMQAIRLLRSGPARLDALDNHMGALERHFADWHAQLASVVEAVTRKAALDDLYRETDQLRDRLVALTDAIERRGAVAAPVAGAAAGVVGTALEQAFYLALERQFRGTHTEIRERLSCYRPWFDGLPAAPIADLGCGRGEWLNLLKEWGLEGVGVDQNALNVEALRADGVNAVCDDAVDWLRRQPDASLAALTAFHLVEHLPFGSLLQLLDQARRVLAPGGRVVIETPNPENLLVATRSFWLDPTHLRPLPPSLIQFVVVYSGFEVEQLLRLNPPEGSDASVTDKALRQLLQEGRDFAIVARRPVAHKDLTSAGPG